MKAKVTIEKDKSGFTAYTENLKTVLHGSGPTVQEALDDLMSCYEDVKKYYSESGDPIPEELMDLSFECY